MWHLSKRSEYGLFFLISLSEIKKGEYLSIRKIAEDNDLPYRFLSQIAASLKNANLINSKEGKGGGYFLVRPANSIKITDIISALDEPVGLVNCQRVKGCKKSGKCKVYPVWNEIQKDVNKALEKFSILDFVNIPNAKH